MEKTKRWDPRCDECAKAFYELAKRYDSYSQIAAKLDGMFLPSSPQYDCISASGLISSMRRGVLSASLQRLYPKEADKILSKFKAENKPKSQQRPKTTGWRSLQFTPSIPRATAPAKPKKVSVVEAPLRKPDPVAAEQSNAIESYLLDLRLRDMRRGLK